MDGIDFLISTIPIPDVLSVPVIVVQTLLGGGDLAKIEQALAGDTKPNLPYLMKELVFLQEDFTQRDEIIAFLGQKMHEKGLVRSSAGFTGLVLEREHAASTAYGNLVAIPHPIIPQSTQTVWAICTLKQPVDWGGKPVQFVCLLSTQQGGSEPPARMYEQLIRLTDDSRIIQQLLNCQTYDEFAQSLVRHKLQ